MSGGPQTEVALPVGAVTVRIAGPEDEVVAGGPLTVNAAVENAGSDALFLMVAADRGTGRPADLTFGGELEGSDVAFDDPAAGAASIGGPAGAVPLAAGRPFAQDLLVNQFLTLERLADAVPAGERQRLTLRMTRVLRVGGDQAEALQAPGTRADVELDVTVRGDPEELDRLTEELARAVSEDTQPGSVAREQALTTLLALRTPAAARHVAALREHPDAGVRARAGA